MSSVPQAIREGIDHANRATAIVHSLKLALGQVEGYDASKVREHLDEAQRAANRLWANLDAVKEVLDEIGGCEAYQEQAEAETRPHGKGD